MALTKITTDIIADGAITSAKLGSGAVSAASLSSITTDNVSEGSTNVYYTDTRARSSVSVTGGNLSYDSGTGVIQLTTDTIRGAISVTDAGGDGSLAYSAGVITYTGPSAAETRAHFSGSTGVSYNSSTGAFTTSAIPNASLSNSSITINSNSVDLGASVTLDTDDVGEGSTNLYYTDARVDSRLASGSVGNIVTTGYIAGPATFTIDPAAVGDNTGTVVIAGDLRVDGTTTTINSTTLTVDDKNILLGQGAALASDNNGAGITVDTANASITYDSTNDEWDFNKDINVTGTVIADGLTVANTGTTRLSVTNNTTSVEGLFGVDANGLSIASPTAPQLAVGMSSGTRLKVLNNSDVSFYNSAGTTAKLFWDASAESLGIGTTSPAQDLHISDTAPVIRLEDTDDGGYAELGAFAGSLTLRADEGNTQASSFIRFDVDSTERVRIDSSGNVGIGTDSPNQSSAGSQHSVLTLKGSGTLGNGIFELIQKGTSGNNQTLGDIRFFDDTNQNVSIEAIRATSTDSGYLTFKTRPAAGSLTERMRIDSSGNVGIGNTSPTSNLTIGSSQSDGLEFTYDSGNAYRNRISNYWNSATDTRMDFEIGRTGNVAPTTVLSVGYNNNVGIGTSSPAAKLHLNSASVTAILFDSDTSTQQYELGIGYGGVGTSSFYLYDNTANASRLVVNSSGNVGIGTSSPAEKLHIAASSYTAPTGGLDDNINLLINNSQYCGIQILGSSAGSSFIHFGDQNNADVGIITYEHNGDYMRFDVNAGERLRILGNNLHLNGGADCRIQLGSGGAGANSTSNNTVHIRGDNTSLKFMAASGGSTVFEQNGTSRFVFGTNDWYLGAFNNSTETLNFRTSNDGTTRFNFYDNNATEGLYIKHTGQQYGGKIIYGARWDDDEDWMAIDLRQSSSGGGYDCRVGIGTTTPAVPLVIQVSASQVNAEMRFQSGGFATDHFKLYANQQGRFYIQNVSTSNGVYLAYNANAWTSASDERLKENIVELDNVLPKISNLRAVKYNFISDEENTTKIGFIAQDWQTDFSEVVSDSIPEELGINYTETIPVLLKAIQEQQTIIDDLKARIETLENP